MKIGSLYIEDASEASDTFFALLVDRRTRVLALRASDFPSPEGSRRNAERTVGLFMRMLGPPDI